MKTIVELYGNRLVTGYPSKHGTDMTLPLPEQLVGIELEIEEWDPTVKQAFGGFSFTEDGSLRRSNTGMGIEAITLPVAIKFVPAMLNAFFKHFGIGDRNYSERCSTHVHFNAQQLTFEQLTTICLVYQTAERLLFGFVGHDRENSIFCVPWTQSNMSCHVVGKLAKADQDSSVFRAWQKYSALNLIPIQDKGTVEFRHLHGTCDVKLITTWIAILAKIFEYAQQVDFEKAKQHIVAMNTVSNYHQWLDMVFGQYAEALRTPNFEELLSIGVIDSKLMLTEKAPDKTTDWLYQALRANDVLRTATGARVAQTAATGNTIRWGGGDTVVVNNAPAQTLQAGTVFHNWPDLDVDEEFPIPAVARPATPPPRRTAAEELAAIQARREQRRQDAQRLAEARANLLARRPA